DTVGAAMTTSRLQYSPLAMARLLCGQADIRSPCTMGATPRPDFDLDQIGGAPGARAAASGWTARSAAHGRSGCASTPLSRHRF
ncbi:hypothetical protein C1T30_43400, partial [Bacillus sp. MBGLi97]